jgi:hypothetical protein
VNNSASLVYNVGNAPPQAMLKLTVEEAAAIEYFLFQLHEAFEDYVERAVGNGWSQVDKQCVRNYLADHDTSRKAALHLVSTRDISDEQWQEIMEDIRQDAEPCEWWKLTDRLVRDYPKKYKEEDAAHWNGILPEQCKRMYTAAHDQVITPIVTLFEQAHLQRNIPRVVKL